MITSIALYPAPVGHWTSFGCEMSADLLAAAGLADGSKVTARAGGWHILLADDAGWAKLHDLAPGLLDALAPRGRFAAQASPAARPQGSQVDEVVLVGVRPDRFKRLGCEVPEDVLAAGGWPAGAAVMAGAANGYIVLADKVPWKRLSQSAPALMAALSHPGG